MNQPPEKKKPAACEPIQADGSTKDGDAPNCPEGYPEEQPTDQKSGQKTNHRSDKEHKKN